MRCRRNTVISAALILIFALAIWALVFYVRVRKQNHFYQAVRSSGGEIYFREPKDEFSDLSYADLPRTNFLGLPSPNEKLFLDLSDASPKTARLLIDTICDIKPQVEILVLRGQELDDEDVDRLVACLPNLKRIDLSKTQIVGKCLVNLVNRLDLIELSLNETQVQHKELQHLSTEGELELLELIDVSLPESEVKMMLACY